MTAPMPDAPLPTALVEELRSLAGKATTGKWYIYTGEDGEPISLAADGVGPNGGWVGKTVAQFGVPYRTRTAEQIAADAAYLKAVQPVAVVSLLDALEASTREVAAKDALIDRLRLEAQIHSGEARAHKATVHEAYQACTGATGEPGNWHGAQPIKQALATAERQRDEAMAALRAIRESFIVAGAMPLSDSDALDLIDTVLATPTASVPAREQEGR